MTEPKCPGRYAKDFVIGNGIRNLRARCGLPAPGTYEGNIPCKGCGTDFRTPDRRSIRFCPSCKSSKHWKGSQASDALYPADLGGMAFKMSRDLSKKTKGRRSAKKQSLVRNRPVALEEDHAESLQLERPGEG